MKKKRYSRILAYTLCLSLLATGCGKSAEDVTDYGSKQTEAENGSTAAKAKADTETQPKTEAGSEREVMPEQLKKACLPMDLTPSGTVREVMLEQP